MLTHFVPNVNANIYLNAATELGYGVTVLSEGHAYARIEHQGNTLYLYRNILSLNDDVSSEFSTNKHLAATMLRQVIPELIPESLLVRSADPNALEEVLEFARHHLFQIVVKPNNASLSKGVTVLPTDEVAVIKAVTSLQAEYSSILVETYIAAQAEFRVVYLKGQFFDCIHRVPAYVEGDGQHTITQLIDSKNQYRDSIGFHQIEIDEVVHTKVAAAGYTLDSILPTGHHLTLKDVCAFAQGGEGHRVAQKSIHSDFLAAFEHVVSVSRLQFVGIDVMCDDLRLPPDKQAAGINEINSASMPDVHYFADLKDGTPLAAAQRLLRRVLEVEQSVS